MFEFLNLKIFIDLTLSGLQKNKVLLTYWYICLLNDRNTPRNMLSLMKLYIRQDWQVKQDRQNWQERQDRQERKDRQDIQYI